MCARRLLAARTGGVGGAAAAPAQHTAWCLLSESSGEDVDVREGVRDVVRLLCRCVDGAAAHQDGGKMTLVASFAIILLYILDHAR